MIVSISNYEMERHFNRLKELYGSDKVMPAAVAYKIVRAAVTMQDALTPFGMVRDQLIKRYSGGRDRINREDDPAAFDACAKELDEIGNKAVQVELPEIGLDELENVNFTLREMESLRLLIKE